MSNNDTRSEVITRFPIEELSKQREVDELWWKVGWHPYRYAVGVLFLCGIIGAVFVAIFGIEIFGSFIGWTGGIGGGLAISYLGAKEVNNNAVSLVSEFMDAVGEESADAISAELEQTYVFVTERGGTPWFVNYRRYYDINTVSIVKDRIFIIQGRTFDLESRETTSSGKVTELMRNQVVSVDYSEVGDRHIIEVRTNGGNSIEIYGLEREIATSAYQDIQAVVNS